MPDFVDERWEQVGLVLEVLAYHFLQVECCRGQPRVEVEAAPRLEDDGVREQRDPRLHAQGTGSATDSSGSHRSRENISTNPTKKFEAKFDF